MLGNRQHSLTLAVGESRGDGTFYATVSYIEKGVDKQIWKWEGNFLISKWNPDYVFDGSTAIYIISKRNDRNIHQKWRLSIIPKNNFRYSKIHRIRFSDGFLVNLGVCKETTVVGDMAIARKWFRVDVDKMPNEATDSSQKLRFNTFLCDEDEICTDINNCYEAVEATAFSNKFCDKDKICCKNKG